MILHCKHANPPLHFDPFCPTDSRAALSQAASEDSAREQASQQASALTGFVSATVRSTAPSKAQWRRFVLQVLSKMYCAGLDLCSLCGDGPEEADGNRTFAIEESPSLHWHILHHSSRLFSAWLAIQGFDLAG